MVPKAKFEVKKSQKHIPVVIKILFNIQYTQAHNESARYSATHTRLCRPENVTRTIHDGGRCLTL